MVTNKNLINGKKWLGRRDYCIPEKVNTYVPRIICPQPPPLSLALKASWQSQKRCSKKLVKWNTSGTEIKISSEVKKSIVLSATNFLWRMDRNWKIPTLPKVRWLSGVNQTKVFHFSCLVISNFYNIYVLLLY